MDESVKQSENLIVTCVYVSDANKCLEQFKIKKENITFIIKRFI